MQHNGKVQGEFQTPQTMPEPDTPAALAVAVVAAAAAAAAGSWAHLHSPPVLPRGHRPGVWTVVVLSHRVWLAQGAGIGEGGRGRQTMRIAASEGRCHKAGQCLTAEPQSAPAQDPETETEREDLSVSACFLPPLWLLSAARWKDSGSDTHQPGVEHDNACHRGRGEHGAG